MITQQSSSSISRASAIALLIQGIHNSVHLAKDMLDWKKKCPTSMYIDSSSTPYVASESATSLAPL